MSNFFPKKNIKIFDTLSNNIQSLKTLENSVLKMYVCGPTIYDRPHLGNARSIVVYDLFYRLFLQVFTQVVYVRNITDVDDKINDRAKECNITIQHLTSQVLNFFYDDVNQLGVLKPTHEPKVTENIQEIIDIIQKLLANKSAYLTDGHVIFDINSFTHYGKLSKRKVEDLIAGSRVGVKDFKKNPLDFVLWKPADSQDDPSSIFESPFGKGRPGWHIECSAMSHKYLGENFDIHGGGADLQFPHHENEIAQSCSAFENSNYATYWIHNGFLTVNGEKMSKSLKNFITVDDLIKQKINGKVIRLMLLSSHYRKPFDFNDKVLSDAIKTLNKFHEVFVNEDLDKYNGNCDITRFKPQEEIVDFLADDLNFAKVLAFLHVKCREINVDKTPQKLLSFYNNLVFLGIFDKNLILNFIDNKIFNSNPKLSDNEIKIQLELRQQYKSSKNFLEADKIRDFLLQNNIILEDKPNNLTVFYRKN